MEPASIRKLRGILAEEKISHTRFAAACGLSRAYLGQILAGTLQPGELARMKIAHGIANLGLGKEAMQHGS